MNQLTATDYTWFIMLGFIVGYVFNLIFIKSKVPTSANLIMGVILGIIGGLIPQIWKAGGNLIIATLVPVITLFVVNIMYKGSKSKLHTRIKLNV